MTKSDQTKNRIYLSAPHMGGEEINFVNEAFNTNWISPVGPNISAFEADLAAYSGVGHVAALSSGTAAIHLALIILGVERNDTVICSTFTFAGSCNPIVYVGATPVFVDSEPDTWNMDPDLLEDAIISCRKRGQTPKAIILVHLYGMPAKIDEILSIAAKYEIPIIEDAAEGLGASYKGKKLGGFGRMGVYSFNGNKIITTSGGGALLSEDIEDINKAHFLSTQARDNAPHYEHSEIGYNYRLSNVSAGIGRGQMLVLDQRVKQRREVYDYYKQNLGDYVSFIDEPEGCFSNRWLTTVLVYPEQCSGVTREDIRLRLEEDNIESRPVWKPMHLQRVFRDAPYFGHGVSDKLFDLGLCLPSGSNLNKVDQDKVIRVIKSLQVTK